MAKRAGPTCAPDSPTWWNNAEGATPWWVQQLNNSAYYSILLTQSLQRCVSERYGRLWLYVPRVGLVDVLSELMTLQSHLDTAPPISPGDAYYPVAQAQNCMCNTVGTYGCT